MKRLSMFIAALLLFLSHLHAVAGTDTLKTAAARNPKLFLDCMTCDLDYFRNNFTLVDYVYDEKVADVSILVVSQGTGGGGTEYRMIVTDRGKLKPTPDTVIFSLPADLTIDESRAAMLEKVELGLVPYLLKSGNGDRLTLFISNEILEEGATTDDPWKNWVFSVRGSGSFSSQKTYKSYSLFANLYVSKVTPEIKLESVNNFGLDESRWLDEDGKKELYKTSQKTFSSSSLLVKSLGGHGGIGGTAAFIKSDFHNVAFQMTIGPAIEYNLFRYADASQKQLRFIYGIAYEHTLYDDTTIYFRTTDQLFRQGLNIIFMYVDSWGFINANAEYTGYLNNLNWFSLGASTYMDIKLFRGFSVNLMCGVYMIRDQIGISNEYMSEEDILVLRREQQTSYSLNFQVGLSYRFGSIFNNVVNPRFGD